MKRTEVKYTFIDPNPLEDTVLALQNIIVENIIRKTARPLEPN